MSKACWALAVVSLAAGCTGLTMGEQTPGGDTYLGFGAIAVDPVTENSFVDVQTMDGTRSQLVVVPPDNGPARAIDNLTDLGDPRILFPAGSIMVMSEVNSRDRLQLLDRTTLAVTHTKQTTAEYNGTRMAPSRDWVAVADNAAGTHASPIDLIDTRDLAIHRITHDGDWLEAMWLNHSDDLVAIVFYASGTPQSHARILMWDVNALAASGFGSGPGNVLWPNPVLDVAVPGVDYDFLFSYTWVGISPDDATAVFPVIRTSDATHVLEVLDLASGALRGVDNALGPVGFTPDSATIVSYRYMPGQEAGTQISDSLTVGRVDLDVDVVPLPSIDGPSFFISHEGNLVLVTQAIIAGHTVLYDVDHQTMTSVAGPAVGLDEFVSRAGHGELWLVQHGLYRLDLMTATITSVPLLFEPAHVNILPTRDRLVVDDDGAPLLRFIDPATQQITRTVSLPSP